MVLQVDEKGTLSVYTHRIIFKVILYVLVNVMALTNVITLFQKEFEFGEFAKSDPSDNYTFKQYLSLFSLISSF